MSEERPKLAKKARLKWDEREQKTMLLYPERGLLLNDTAAEIVKLCDGAHSVAQIVDTLVAKLAHESSEKQADRATIEHDVIDLLTRLRERKLLE
jgi:pyrroloquinoline quinone biosynthesis protein D